MTADTGNVGYHIMTFYPTKDEFKDFSRYVAYMESQGAHNAGIAKVIPPKGWRPRQTYDDIDDLVIPAPIQQVVTGQSGLFTQYNIQKKPMTVHEFRKTSNLEKFCYPQHADCDELERKFWKNLTFNPPLYGAEVSGSLYDQGVTEWNIGCLNTILDCVENESSVKTKGLNKASLCFGMWKSAFAWHTEDMDLYSISYLHFGEPQSWYVVPPDHGKRLEALAKGFFPGSAQSCEAFLRHKMTLISPSILKKYGIPFEKVTQHEGQFILTFPFAYHAGFNHGFNCAESTNFATLRWIDYGKQATQCACRQDMVKISMDVFVRKYQPERYKIWKAGKDTTPIDHSRPTPESALLRKDIKKKRIPIAPAASSPLVKADNGYVFNTIFRKSCKYTTIHVCLVIETKQEKEPKPPSKFPAKVCPKKSSNRRNPLKKEKSRAEGPDRSNREPCDNELMSACSEGVEGSDEQPAVTSPQAKVFQRTLSPTDVLHVHSYAKGDYSEEEEPPFNERKTDATDSGAVKDSGQPLHTVICACCSAEVPEEMIPVNEGGLEGESWAKPLAHLWQSRPPNPKKEREYNLRMGMKPPYCCICALFHTYQQMEVSSSANSPIILSGNKMRTKPLIPESCFSINTEEDSEDERSLTTAYMEEDGTSLLISCSECCVRVHASCYGVDPASVDSDWKCAHCKANALTESCCLCSLRGGALQKANNNKWVHVLCAVAVLEARFVNITDRSPVDLSGIPLQRFKLKCYYCKKRMKKALGCCVQCSHGRCPTAYHPTCAQAAGVLMQPDHWPFVVHVTCCRHKGPTQIERNKAAMHELTVGQRVICKHKNGRYYQCDVVQLSTETFYEVNFDDGSFSDNLFPEDIVGRDCVQLGPPPQGEEVQVRWTDGLVYGAKFVAAHVIQMYLVEFEDGSQLTAKRDDVYTLDEELPKRVKSRLSKASDMRFDGIFEEKEIIQESKRQRVINSRYRGDYIEPVIYRAIME
uniref:[histone H3]-trimethyl-L-lysine(9) demethylase n=1 Tax=Periophthalmus magnuspinnatus TaxID=409849 RepID=A0A3B4AY92_9GOBI